MSLTTALIAALAPAALEWTRRHTSHYSKDGKHFRPMPVLRALYPGGLITFGWSLAFAGKEIMWPKEFERGSLGPYFLGLLALYFLSATIWSWPATIVVQNDGLSYRRLFRLRRMILWANIEDVGISVDGRLVIYARQGKQVELSEFTEGRSELKDLIQKKIRTRT